MSATQRSAGHPRAIFQWPHLRVGAVEVTEVPAGRGVPAHRRFLVDTACGAHVPTTLVTLLPARVGCEACREAKGGQP